MITILVYAIIITLSQFVFTIGHFVGISPSLLINFIFNKNGENTFWCYITGFITGFIASVITLFFKYYIFKFANKEYTYIPYICTIFGTSYPIYKDYFKYLETKKAHYESEKVIQSMFIGDLKTKKGLIFGAITGLIIGYSFIP